MTCRAAETAQGLLLLPTQTTEYPDSALALTEPGTGGETSTVYVATKGTPYVLRIVTKGGEDDLGAVLDRDAAIAVEFDFVKPVFAIR